MIRRLYQFSSVAKWEHTGVTPTTALAEDTASVRVPPATSQEPKALGTTERRLPPQKQTHLGNDWGVSSP